VRQFGLIGYPLSQSFSKRYCTEKFEKEGLNNCVYENFPLGSISELPAMLANNPSLEGFNITIPYKEQVVPFLAEQSAVVRETGACNCVKIKGGRLTGYNTDVTGFELSLKEKLAAHHKRALILGTGGAAKAVEYVLQHLGISYQYVSRKASARTISYAALTPALLETHTLIINTTPLGMYPNVDELPPLPYEALGNNHYLFDLVYNPAKTLFLLRGEERGSVIKNGQDMLLIQAEESWKIWNDVNL